MSWTKTHRSPCDRCWSSNLGCGTCRHAVSLRFVDNYTRFRHLIRKRHVMTLCLMLRVCIFLLAYLLAYLLVASIVIVLFIRTIIITRFIIDITILIFQVYFATALCCKQNEVRTFNQVYQKEANISLLFFCSRRFPHPAFFYCHEHYDTEIANRSNSCVLLLIISSSLSWRCTSYHLIALISEGYWPSSG